MGEVVEFKFGEKGIRAVVIDDAPWWVAKDVCGVLGLDDVRRAVERLDDDEKLSGEILQSGQKREMWLMNESGLYSLILRSNKPEAKAFKKWITSEVLPSIRKTGGYGHSVEMTEIEKSKEAAKVFIDLVNPPDSGKILLAHSVCKKHNLPVDILPSYAEERVTFSMSFLLKKNEISISAQKVNRKLVEVGILEEKTRHGSHGDKKFFVITKAGEKYGKNLISPQNPRETQPHWYEDTFSELIKMVA